MRLLLITAITALVFSVPAGAGGPVQSPDISGLVPVTLHASGLMPGGSYTPEWKVFRSDTDPAPFTYFRSAVTADSTGEVTTSVPLEILSDYGSYLPYDIEMSLLQPDAQGFLQPVYDTQGREYCVLVPVWEYASTTSCIS